MKCRQPSSLHRPPPKPGMISAIFATNKISNMKNTAFLLLTLLSFGCHSQSQPKVPATDASKKDLRWSLNDLLTMQLPSSLPDSLNGVTYLKTFTTTFSMTDSTTLEIPELWRTVAKDSIFSGSKYYLPLAEIDVKNIRLVTSPDEKYTAILIPAKPGSSFVHRPYGNEPERRVAVVTIGWYDRVQDRTLARAYVLWKQYLGKLIGD